MQLMMRGGTILALLVLAGVLAGCEETATVAPRAPVELSVSPAGPLEMKVGDRVQLSVSISGAADPSFTLNSSDSTVATVSRTGLVSAVSHGTTTVVAASVEDPGARAAVLVRVLDPVFPSDTTQSAVLVDSVRPISQSRTGDPAAFAGRVRAYLRLQRGNAARLEVTAGNRVVCTQQFLTASGGALARSLDARVPARVLCEFDTAQFDSLTGEVAFPNGPLAVAARLIGPRDSVRAGAAPVVIALNNPDALIARVEAEKLAVGTDGRPWFGGQLKIVALPIVYSPARQVRSARFSYSVPGAEITLVHVDSAPPFEVAFSSGVAPPQGGLAGLVDPSLRVAVSSTFGGGGAGPQTTSTPISYDDRAPVPGPLTTPEWVGSDTRFAELYRPAAEEEPGVGGVTVRFFAGDPRADGQAIVESGTPVSAGADLPESAPGTYRLAARVCDALGNCSTVRGGVFGVDLKPPVIVEASSPERIVNPTGSLSIALTDELSGFGPTPLLASTVRAFPALRAEEACGYGKTPGVFGGSVCRPERVGLFLPLEEDAGYYTYSLQAEDRAGNRSGVRAITVLRDVVRPSLLGLQTPAVFGRESLVAVTAQDNLDLTEVQFRFVFPHPDGGYLRLPFAPARAVGTAFDEVLTTNAVVSTTLPFLRTLTFAERTTGRVTVLVDSLRAEATDAAGNATQLSFFIPRTALSSAAVADPFESILSVASSVDFSRVCTARCLATDPTRVTFTLQARGKSGLRNPFQQVYVYLRAPGGSAKLLGTTSAVAVTETGDEKTLTYRFAFTPSAGLEGEYTVFAVAAGGEVGLRTRDLSVQLLTR